MLEHELKHSFIRPTWRRHQSSDG